LPDFLIAFGIVAVVLTVASLVSGLVERAPISFPILFLGLGFLVGEKGLGVLEMGPHDETLEIVATLTLALVLFLDAVRLNVRDLGRRWLVPFLILGPGTAFIIVLGAVPLALMLGFGWILAFIGGAVLASTDPVILRDVIRDRRIPQSVRQVLKIEAGMNDLALAALVIFGIRPLVLGAILSSARMSWEARGFISWFGPRGLNLLLLALIAVAAGVPGAEVLMATVGIVVLASAAIHGASTTPVA
jgi:NhaP-type Na+/H+ or K+/H+ antiporter